MSPDTTPIEFCERNLAIVHAVLSGSTYEDATRPYGLVRERGRQIVKKHCLRVNPHIYHACNGPSNRMNIRALRANAAKFI